MEFLNRIRTPEKPVPVKKQIFITIGILLFGIFMGVFSKFLDHRQAELQGFLQVIDSAVDLHNFLGEFGPWILIAVLISVYSISPLWSAVRVFLFFAGMVSSYYLYCQLFPSKLRDDLGRVYLPVAFLGLGLLVRKREGGFRFPAFFRDHQRPDQYDVCLWNVLSASERLHPQPAGIGRGDRRSLSIVQANSLDGWGWYRLCGIALDDTFFPILKLFL